MYRIEIDGIDFENFRKNAGEKAPQEATRLAVVKYHKEQYGARFRPGEQGEFNLRPRSRATMRRKSRKGKDPNLALVFTGRTKRLLEGPTAEAKASGKNGVVLKMQWPPHIQNVSGGRSKRTDAAAVARNRVLDLRAELSQRRASDARFVEYYSGENLQMLLTSPQSKFALAKFRKKSMVP